MGAVIYVHVVLQKSALETLPAVQIGDVCVSLPSSAPICKDGGHLCEKVVPPCVLCIKFSPLTSHAGFLEVGLLDSLGTTEEPRVSSMASVQRLPMQADPQQAQCQELVEQLQDYIFGLPASAWKLGKRKCIKHQPDDVVKTMNLGSTCYNGETFIAQATYTHLKIIELFVSILKMCFPTFKYHCIALLKDYNSKPHVDSGDLGPSCCMTLGAFQGGCLSGEGWSLQAFQRPTLFSSAQPHWGESYTGTRVNVIAFTRKEFFTEQTGLQEWATLVELGFPIWDSLDEALRWAQTHQCPVNRPTVFWDLSMRDTKFNMEAMDRLMLKMKEVQKCIADLAGVRFTEVLVPELQQAHSRMSLYMWTHVFDNKEWYYDGRTLKEYMRVISDADEMLRVAAALVAAPRLKRKREAS